MTLDIPKDVAERLKALAKDSDVKVGDLLRDMLEQTETDEGQDKEQWATLADLARNAEEFAKAIQRQDIVEGQQLGNTAANGREILKEIYAEKFGPPNR